MDYVFCFPTVTFPPTHLIDRNFFNYLPHVPTMVCSHMSSSISQSILFTVSVMFENYLMQRLRDYEDIFMISPLSCTHCHVQAEVLRLWMQWFLANGLGSWDLSCTLLILLSCTFSLQFLGIREGCDVCFSDAYSPLWAAARITEVENKEDSDNWGKYEKNCIMCLEPSTST
jgi:hypothetical protein